VKPKEYRNIITGALVVCTNPSNIRIIEGVEYLVVTQPGHYRNRNFMIRKDSLKPVVKNH